MKNRKKLRKEDRLLLQHHSAYLQKNGQLEQTRHFIQHGNTSVFAHVHSVAAIALKLNRAFKIGADKDALIRSSLLHDYFLYDWHDASHEHPRPHGFYHPKVAMENAHEHYELNEREKDAILRHMFPLTIIPPKHREGWLLTIADKISTLKESAAFWKSKIRKKQKDHGR